MGGNFLKRTNHLLDEVGDGNLEMGMVVSQPYAAAEHEHFDAHPRGGMRKYIEYPFEWRRDAMIQKLADNAVVPQGSRLKDAAVDVSGEFDDMVRKHAPARREGYLEDSTSYWVIDNGIEIFRHEATDPYRWDKD